MSGYGPGSYSEMSLILSPARISIIINIIYIFQFYRITYSFYSGNWNGFDLVQYL